MYIYTAKVESIYDGDTVRLTVDLGFSIKMHKETFRLYGIDTPELRGEEREAGLKARDWLREQILGEDVIVKTYKDKKGKYGRYLAEIIYKGRNMNEELVEKGYAVKKDY